MVQRLKTQRTKRILRDLNKEETLYLSKAKVLREALAIEVDEGTRFKLERQITDIEKKLARLERQWTTLAGGLAGTSI
jgi:hypothetical protein